MKIITIIQLVVAILLCISILLQSKGSGLSGDFGGYYTKRGMEKFLFYFSITLSIIFVGFAIATIVIANK